MSSYDFEDFITELSEFCETNGIALVFAVTTETPSDEDSGEEAQPEQSRGSTVWD